MATTLSRIIKFGIQNFLRNGWLSVATIAVLVLALLVFHGLIVFGVISQTAVASIKDKIDISVYFKDSAPEDEILKVEREIEGLAEVKSVDYVSKDRALDAFKDRHKEDAVIAQALAELQANPLLASLNIKAKDPKEYPNIVERIQDGPAINVIEKISYAQNKSAIERLARLVDTFGNAGLAITITLALIGALVTFNSVRLAIYSNREEIGIMRLVGASNKFINGPYIVSGLIYGVIAAILSLAAAAPIIALASPYVEVFVPEMNLQSYFYGNLISFFGYHLLFGVVLGVVSSAVAVQRYLKL
ncbi:MAG: permease-like cell division protein FtsX [Patescibacteria group bacterium]